MHVYIIISPSARCDILTLLVMNINLFWDRMPYNLVINYWYSLWTTLKMKAVVPLKYEILLPRYQTEWHHIPDNHNLHFASCFSSPYSTGCHRRKGPNFGRVFLMLNYTDIIQNTYIQSWMVTEIMAREVWNFDSCYTLIDCQIHIETGRNMWFL